MQYESDLCPLKPTTDITLNATAFAPHGVERTAWLAGMQVAEQPPVMLRVCGPRHWHRLSGVPMLSLAEHCSQVLLRFENAFGGQFEQLASPMNPVGCGYWPVCNASGEMRGHQIEWANDLVHEGNAHRPHPPAGFGAQHRSWQPRLALAGSYDADWLAAQQAVLPHDYQEEYTLAGCAALRPQAYLTGGETLTFYCLTPEHPKAYLELPNYQFAWQAQQADDSTLSGQCQLDSLHLEMEQGLAGAQLSLCWRAIFPADSQLKQLSAIAVSDSPLQSWVQEVCNGQS